ncbi:uncharacterized protein LOC132560702 [Ylistrum balloti]|uniref:uncharacterized protein LOC132560702 n=1 Tax=Ylistrum balloti TaxID=509963 RepID=UPI002905BC51|nr:uncharacterized protein LOC132560702 [Ylistrum balloti]
MDRLQIATVIVVPIVMLITVTSTVIFFCRRRGKFQMFRGVPKSQTNEKLTNDTPNNHQEKISNAMSDPETTTVAVLCSQRNVIVEKVSKLFAKFIKSKSQVLTIDESCSEFKTQAYIQKWRNGQQAYILLILLSDELLDGVDKIKRGLDISKTSGLKLDLPLLNLLMEIDQVTYEHLPPVMLVCVYSGLCARFLELLPNLGQLYSVVDDFDQHKCQLRSTDLEQLFVSLCSGHVSPPVTLSHSSLIGCVQTRLLLAAIQELLHTKGNQSTTPYSRSKPNQPEAIAVDSTTYQCAYRAPSVGRPAYVYRDIVRRGTSCFDNGCVRHNASSHQGVQPLDSRRSTQTCIRVGGYSVHPQIALCESVSGQTDSGFDTMTSSVGIDEAESVPFVVRSKVAANTDQRMKEHTSGQEELALFISPESDEEYDGVSLSQRIVELNERHTTQWSKP